MSKEIEEYSLSFSLNDDTFMLADQYGIKPKFMGNTLEGLKELKRLGILKIAVYMYGKSGGLPTAITTIGAVAEDVGLTGYEQDERDQLLGELKSRGIFTFQSSGEETKKAAAEYFNGAKAGNPIEVPHYDFTISEKDTVDITAPEE